MPTVRERWNQRHRNAGEAPRAPDAFVARMLSELGPGAERRALDLACGLGRHALLLAELGYDAQGWDVSDVALELLRQRAAERGLAIRTRQLDLEQAFPSAEPPAELVVVVDYLDRTLLSALHALLEPGGHALVATFTDDWPEAHPSARFRLRRNELAAGIVGLETLRFEEQEGRAGILARRPA